MGSVFAVAGFAVAATPWPRMSYAERCRASAATAPTRAFGSSSATSQRSSAAASSRSSRAPRRGGTVRAINAGARELSRSEQDALSEFVQRYGARPSPDHGRRRRLAGKPREVLHRRADRRRQQQARAADEDLLLFVADTDASRRRRSERCALNSASASGSSTTRDTTCCGSSSSRCSSTTRWRAATRRCTIPSRHRPRRTAQTR